ncbi:hypothetical protein HDU91_007175 [Kappamyces sp. JEL0680]|nr:hypothetical protein HDU91_007175 [Kappamyces sp. JEL0680]
MANQVRPPKNWINIHDKIKVFRKSNKAPVDSIGCAMLFDRKAEKHIQRYQILTSLQLSSQTKDPVTAAAIENLKTGLEGGLTPQAVANASSVHLNQLIGKVGFHNRKTVYLQKTAVILMEKYNGDIPPTLDEMLELPGFGPKMAYLCMQEAWGTSIGIGVDTHVHRICHRLGWVSSKAKNPEDTRKELQAWLPQEYWSTLNELLVGFGQIHCKPVGPLCHDCPVQDQCPKIGVKLSSQSLKRPSAGPASDVQPALPGIEDGSLLATKPAKKIKVEEW